ncbi:MAG: minor capsid protein, partial [candidate division Zixibacteria bacterium]|nr:minor capsid protein [candidate division Zixibacteria bacterium]
MSTTQYLTDTATRHAVFLQRYAGGQSKEAASLLYRIRRDINARLANEPTIFQKSRLDALLMEINAITAAGFKNIELQQIAAAQELVIAESRFSVGLFNKAATVDFVRPSSSMLIAATMTSGMVAEMKAGVTIEAALQQFGVKKSKQIAQIISDGVVFGDTTPVISQKVGETINTLHKRQLDSLVRTITNNVSSVARGQVYYANRDILDGYQWVATLDSRTTMICGSRDGKIYQYGSGPMPPAHWGCRSTTIPKVKPEYDMGAKIKGDRPSIGAGGVEKVSARTTYGGWLKRQPKAFIDEA